MTAPLEVSREDVEAPSDAEVQNLGKVIEGRSLGQIAWTRLKRDKVALGGGIVVLLLIVIAVFAPLIVKLLAHPPNEPHYEQLNDVQMPLNKHGGINGRYLFGVEPQNGRDLFSRTLYGAQISLLIAFLSTLLAVVIGTVLGIVAGYFGGWVDTLIGRIMDIFLAFPLLLFAIALVGVLPTKAFGLTGNPLRIAVMVFIIGFFSWPYIGRIIRGQTLSLREREFVDAARSLGARSPYIIFRELLPNIVAPILIYATLLIPTNILFEAGLSYLGVGVIPPRASWGGMLSDATNFYQVDPEFLFPPGVAIFVTVLAFNLFGDGLRDALDPRAR